MNALKDFFGGLNLILFFRKIILEVFIPIVELWSGAKYKICSLRLAIEELKLTSSKMD